MSEMSNENKILLIEQNYTMFKMHEEKFKEISDNLKELDVEYQEIYADVKEEYDRLTNQHFEGTFLYDSHIC